LRICIDSLVIIAATLTSAAMLGYKLAHVEIIKFAIDEQKRLEEERAALLSELGESLSPELALQVEKVIDRRQSFVPNGLATVPSASKLPKLARADEAESEDTQSTAQEVRSSVARSAISLCSGRCAAALGIPSLDLQQRTLRWRYDGVCRTQCLRRAQVRSVASSESGDVMTPFGALNRTTSEARARAQAIHVQPITPRTRALSDQFNPEAEHALTPTRARQPDAAKSDAGALFNSVVPYAGPGAEVQSVDSGGRAPSGSNVHPLSLKSPDSSDGSDDEEGRAVLDANAK
jgi:hypothetical protein